MTTLGKNDKLGHDGDQDHGKLRELILYVSSRCMDHRLFGATKLNKILFFSDFIAYERFGRSITGEEYFRLPKGPAPRLLVRVRDEMVANDELRIVPREVLGRVQDRPVPLRKPDLGVFSASEIALVDEVIEILRDKRAEEVSELSHYFLGWRLAADKETIPYESVFCRDMTEADITETRLRQGLEIARRHGLIDSVPLPDGR